MEPAEQIAEARGRNGGADESGSLNSTAAIIIALMAMLLAITSLGGGNAAEDVANNNIHASDTWAFYQAKTIRQTGLKVQTQVQGDQLRVTGKSKNDLQQAIALLKERDEGLPLRFTNYR